MVDYSGELKAYGAPANGRHTFRITPYATRYEGEPLAAAVTMVDVNVAAGRFKMSIDFAASAERSDALWLGVEVAGADGRFTALPQRSLVATSGVCWDTAGNTLSGTEFIGSTNDSPFEVRQNNTRAVQITYGVVDPYAGANVAIGTNNSITNAAGAFVAGGGNTLDQASFATIAGGYDNLCKFWSRHSEFLDHWWRNEEHGQGTLVDHRGRRSQLCVWIGRNNCWRIQQCGR
ncbi:MAG TPA: hypothetical protein VGH81_02415 [Rudaea sp.]